MEPEELGEALRSGSSIADVAEQNGVDLQTIIDDMVAAAQAKADENPDSERAQNFDADVFEEKLTERLNSTFEPRTGETDGDGLGGRRPHRHRPGSGPSPTEGDVENASITA